MPEVAFVELPPKKSIERNEDQYGCLGALVGRNSGNTHSACQELIHFRRSSKQYGQHSNRRLEEVGRQSVALQKTSSHGWELTSASNNNDPWSHLQTELDSVQN